MSSERFKVITESDMALDALPLAYAKAVRESPIFDGFTPEKKREALQYVREWAEFAQRTNIDSTNPFAVRYALSRFAEEHFPGTPEEHIALASTSVEGLEAGGVRYDQVLPADKAILQDKDVAIYGGSARVALKMFAGVPVESELPVADLDIILHAGSDTASKAKEYGVELAGARIMPGQSLLEEIGPLLRNIDCSMNQCVVYEGRLYYTPLALKDVKEGNIRILCNEDPLFGSGAYPLPDGNVYLNKKGFYRGLSFLLRGKGKRLLVSQENLDREKDTIGRYWLVMLYVKLLKMRDPALKDRAVRQWFEVAYNMGATQTNSPVEFLEELKQQFPEMRFYSEANFDFNNEQQTRWLIGKLVNRVEDELFRDDVSSDLPTTYTPANIELSEPKAYDLAEFYELANKY